MCNLCKYNNGEYKSLCLDCPCGSGDYYTEHLLQEIKSAMEKGKNNGGFQNN